MSQRNKDIKIQCVDGYERTVQDIGEAYPLIFCGPVAKANGILDGIRKHLEENSDFWEKRRDTHLLLVSGHIGSRIMLFLGRVEDGVCESFRNSRDQIFVYFSNESEQDEQRQSKGWLCGQGQFVMRECNAYDFSFPSKETLTARAYEAMGRLKSEVLRLENKVKPLGPEIILQ